LYLSTFIQLARCCTFRGSNPCGGEIFRTRPDRLWNTPSLQYNGWRDSFLRKMLQGRDVDQAHHLASRLKKECDNIYNHLYAFVAFSRVKFIYYLFLFFRCLFLHTKKSNCHPIWLVGWLDAF